MSARRLSQVMTVLGPVPLDQLGRTLIHEHLYVAFAGAEYDPLSRQFDRKAFVLEAANRLRQLREAHGVRTFEVDPCPIELGRDVKLMAEISERAEMHVVCTTGFYMEAAGLPFYWRDRTMEEVAELYIDEIARDIGGTGIRAGAIKVATSQQNMTQQEAKFLAAACIAQRETGVPIITHTDKGLGGPEQQAAFADGGVEPHRCLIGHCCGNADQAYHRRIADGGSYVGFDRIGMPRYMPDAVRADGVAALARAGYLGQVMMSMDRVCGWLGRYLRRLTPEDMNEELKRYDYLFTDFIPLLRQRGMSDAEIYSILDDNPRRFFAGEAPSSPQAPSPLEGPLDQVHQGNKATGEENEDAVAEIHAVRYGPGRGRARPAAAGERRSGRDEAG